MSRALRAGCALAPLLAALLTTGCASLAPVLGPAPATPQVAGAGTTRGTDTRPSHAAADTLPSPEAVRVLATIPEPLAAGERVAPAVRADIASGDTAAADSGAGVSDSSARDVPIPAPTTPLGDRPGTLERMTSPDSAGATTDSSKALISPARTAAAREKAAGAPLSPASAPSKQAKRASGPTAGEDCFRLQVGAPTDPRKAESLRKAAESQLDLRFQVKKSRGLYKIRSRDCLGREAVDHLRARARAAGFRGVFAVPEGTP